MIAVSQYLIHKCRRGIHGIKAAQTGGKIMIDINIEVMALGMQSKEHGANIQMFTCMENYVSLFGEVRWKRQGITF